MNFHRNFEAQRGEPVASATLKGAMEAAWMYGSLRYPHHTACWYLYRGEPGAIIAPRRGKSACGLLSRWFGLQKANFIRKLYRGKMARV